MINCQNSRQYLNQYLDSELEPKQASELSRHLSECPACRAYFEGEARLEKKLVKIIGQADQASVELWDKAVASLAQNDKVAAPARIKSRRLMYFIPLTSAALIMITIGILLLFAPLPASMDLLQASEKVHQSVLSPGFKPDFQTDSADTLTSYFKERYQKETPGCDGCMKQGGKCRMRGGRMCQLKQRLVPHIVMDYNSTPVSVLVLSEADLGAFPQAADHLSRCRDVYTTNLNEFNYALVRIGPNVVCAVSKADQAILSQLLIDMGATAASCGGCPKSK